MPKAIIEAQGKVGILRLSHGVINAIGPSMVDDLSEAVGEIRTEFQGMVLAGGEKFLSMGFDLPELLRLDRNGMAHFFHRFNELVCDLYTLPLPTVCAIRGHAVAGGCILAMTCDYRFAASGKKMMGLNEIKLGVPVPHLPDLILRQIAGDRAATEMCYGGELFNASDAMASGLVDEVFSMEDVEARAVEKAARLCHFPQEAFSAIKAGRTEPLRSEYKRQSREKAEIFLDCWFSKPARKLLEEASKKF